MASVSEQLLAEQIAALKVKLDGTQENIQMGTTHIWIIFCAGSVMMMHAGFAMLEAGCCRSSFVQSVLEKNLLNCCVSTAGWWMFGWAFAYGGTPDKGFIGGQEAFFSQGFLGFSDTGHITPSQGNLDWFFQWAFCMTSATIVSGAVAERLKIGGFCVFCFLMTAFIYPVVVAWTWSGTGWLNHVGAGYLDFAGSGIVHMCGGVGALCGAKIVGVRTGRFDDEVDQDMFSPHSVPLIVLGTFILWFGWYGFNCGSTLSMNDAATAHIAAQAAVNTTLSCCFGGMTTAFFRRWQTGRWNAISMCGGMLGGLVSITAGCSQVRAYSAVLIGSIGGFVYMGAGDLMIKFKIDDPVEAAPIHGACGAWGTLAAALFDWGKGQGNFHGWSGLSPSGFSYGDGILANVVGIIAISAWSGTMLTIVFVALKAGGFLRISVEEEHVGLDDHEFTPTRAYRDAAMGDLSPRAMKVAPFKGEQNGAAANGTKDC